MGHSITPIENPMSIFDMAAISIIFRGPKDHIDTRISHSSSKAQYKGNTRNHGVKDPYVYVVAWGPNIDGKSCLEWGLKPVLLTCLGLRARPRPLPLPTARLNLLGCSGDSLMGLVMAYYSVLQGVLIGLPRSTDYPSMEAGLYLGGCTSGFGGSFPGPLRGIPGYMKGI